MLHYIYVKYVLQGDSQIRMVSFMCFYKDYQCYQIFPVGLDCIFPLTIYFQIIEISYERLPFHWFSHNIGDSSDLTV